MKKIIACFSTLAVLALSGCGSEEISGAQPDSPSSYPHSDFVSLPEEELDVWQQRADLDEGGSIGHVIMHEGEMVLLLGGSSSCPPTPEYVEFVDDSLLVQIKEMGKNRACTDDYRMHGWSMGIPDDIEPITSAEMEQGDNTQPLKVVSAT